MNRRGRAGQAQPLQFQWAGCSWGGAALLAGWEFRSTPLLPVPFCCAAHGCAHQHATRSGGATPGQNARCGRLTWPISILCNGQSYRREVVKLAHLKRAAEPEASAPGPDCDILSLPMLLKTRPITGHLLTIHNVPPGSPFFDKNIASKIPEGSAMQPYQLPRSSWAQKSRRASPAHTGWPHGSPFRQASEKST